MLAACMLISGCGVIRENSSPGREVPVSELDLSGLEYYGRVEKSAVYFYNETSGTLTAELRTLVIEQDKNPAQTAIEQLLAGPSNDSLRGVAPQGMTLDYIEYSRGVANVYLLYEGTAMQPRQAYLLELAIANTVTDILGASHIHIFYNGMRAGFMGYPSAPLRKQTGSFEEAFLNAYARYVPEIQVADEELDSGEQDVEERPPKTTEINTVLYFVSAGGDFILPEVRSVRYAEIDYIRTLIEELKRGAQNLSGMESPFAATLQLIEDPVFIETQSGGELVQLFFDSRPVRSDFSHQKEMMLSYAALIYTITSFMPNIESVQIYMGETPIAGDNADGLFLRSNLKGYIGSSVPIYFADRNSDLLLEVQRSIEQGRTWSAKARVLELLRGPLSPDADNTWPVMPTGVSEADILAVDVYNDTAYVNLSQHFKEACANFSAKNEMLLVFSIVNTITAMDGISKVQFMIEGEQTLSLAGHLCLSDPFLRNHGIIKVGA